MLNCPLHTLKVTYIVNECKSRVQHCSQADMQVLHVTLVTGQPRARASRYRSLAPVCLRFICNHSSKRSQSSVIWSFCTGASLASSSALCFHSPAEPPSTR